MHRLWILAFAAACAPSVPEVENRQQANSRPETPATDASSPPALPSNDTLPETRADQRTPEAARAVAQRYFALLASGEPAEARKLWSDDEARRAFETQLPPFRTLRASVAAPGQMEGAAGSSYVDIAFQLFGDSTVLDGTMTLRRANDVPGSTAEQRQWRIYRASVQAPPQPT